MVRRLLILCFVAGTLGITGCQGLSQPTAHEVLVHGAEIADTVTTVHFTLQQPNVSLKLSSGVRIADAQGDVEATDRVQMKFTMLLGGGLSADEQLIAIGDDHYVTNPWTSQWQDSPSAAAPHFLDRHRGMSGLLRAITDPQRLSDEVIDAVKTLHIRGAVPTSAIAQMMDCEASTDTVEVEVWLGADDAFVRQVMLEGPLNPGDAESTIRTIRFSDYNQAVTIERPAI